MNEKMKEPVVFTEITPPHRSGMAILILNILLMAATLGVAILFAVTGGIRYENGGAFGALNILIVVVGLLYSTIIGPVICAGLKVLKPNEAYVFTLFGKYYGTLRGSGFYFVNPFVTAIHIPPIDSFSSGVVSSVDPTAAALVAAGKAATAGAAAKKVSLKAMTLNNDKQKINDQLGNPVIIGVIVVWRVVNAAMAVFNVDNYKEFLSIQTDSALRNIVRMYPYDVADDDDEKTLRSSSAEIAEKLRTEIAEKTAFAGLEILEARITHLAYAPEIASAMLQRQQASAIIDARKLIVDGAVGMVEMALDRLQENNTVALDEERKAAMVSNLLVVLCGNRDAQPIVNSGSIY